ncbi:FAD-binding protein [Actinoplanes sp. NPDC051851]|uniref:FAD-binding protein n=1 Tax=Actinoplanes sp. NPDC051851 TaxID=3154753 RepID=UPI0034256F28
MEERVDVVVVGFGAAGACAAIEAAEAGARVLVLDRFGGGGATAISGGVVYAGGGTSVQLAAGATDTPEAMAAYLRHETGDAVTPATLRRFCAESPAMIDWLAARGVPFHASLCPDKTSYPTNRHYLYVSGNERAYPDPAPRGHRTHAPGTSGRLLFARLESAARAAGARVLTRARVHRLIVGADGVVAGVEGRWLRGWPAVVHRLLHRFSVKPGLYLPRLGRALHRPVALLEARYGRPFRVEAGAVILATGGFVFDRAMMREHAPGHRGVLRLGTPGDDGSGIRLGVAAGGATRLMDRVSLWRFLTPPSALAEGVLVDRDGRRFCDESRYGAAIGEALHRRPGGRAWLLIDADVRAEARRRLREQTLWFQRPQAWWWLGPGRISAPTVEEVAGKAGITPPTERKGLSRPPWSLIPVSTRGAPMLTLGGLRADESTGQVLRADGSGIPGLYAAGRTAAGICSRSYVSGLSLADCVFSGRRAGRAVLADKGEPSAHRD